MSESTQRLVQLASRRGNGIPAVVVDAISSGSRASVRLSTNGALLKNIEVVGGAVTVGLAGVVNYYSGAPVFTCGAQTADSVPVTQDIKTLGKWSGANAVYLLKPLTSSSWDGGEAVTTAARGIIDLSAVFGVPDSIRAVYIRLEHTDSTPGSYCTVGPSLTYVTALATVTQVDGIFVTASGWIPCNSDGNIYFYNSEDMEAVKIEIWGYAF